MLGRTSLSIEITEVQFGAIKTETYTSYLHNIHVQNFFLKWEILYIFMLYNMVQVQFYHNTVLYWFKMFTGEI